MSARWVWVASLAVLSLMAAACGSDSELEGVKAERDALAAQLSAVQSRYEQSRANQELIAEIIADPEAFGDRDEVLDKMEALAVPGAVMDDTAFGAVPIRSAWDNTVFGTNSTLTTWTTWLAADGSSGGSLWTWSGTASNGEPFELIGVNLDEYDENGLVTYSLVDWPYPATTVRDAVSTGGPG
ncbi:MAG: hypothetical protein ACR2N9_10995 [Acidimicrobiia bacterium]